MPPRATFTFGPYRLDLGVSQLQRSGEPVALSPRQYAVLRELVVAAGRVVSKDHLINVAWAGEPVGDSSLEKIIAQVRQRLADDPAVAYIETVARRGYRFAAVVAQETPAPSDADLDAMMAPHSALMDGRALIETLDGARIDEAVAVFEQLVARDRHHASCHVGLANALTWRFEMTRATPTPDVDGLQRAVFHATEARRLDPHMAEAWATYGFVVERTGDHRRAVAALRHATAIEPDNWRHHLRLAYATWGDERLRASRRALDLWPRLPEAHLLAATVFVARDALPLAVRELHAGLAAMPEASGPSTARPAVALHWLKGLIALARGADAEAMASFDRELALEPAGHLYARECCAHTWYAKGACHLRRGERAMAVAAFEQALTRVPAHPMAHAGLAWLDGRRDGWLFSVTPSTIDIAAGRAAVLVGGGDVTKAVSAIADALASTPPGSGGWTIPIDPLLGAQQSKEIWTPVLVAIGHRAS